MAQDQQPAGDLQKICQNCGAEINSEAIFCSSCGVSVGTEPTIGQVTLEFLGTGFHYLGFFLIGILLAVGIGVLNFQAGQVAVYYSRFVLILLQLLVVGLIAPPFGAWYWVAINRWFVGNLSLSDGTQAEFRGRGVQIWGYLVVLNVSPLILGLIPYIGPALLLFLTTGIYLEIIRWFYRNINLSSPVRLEFQGGYWTYLGFTLLLILSLFTIVAWGWVASALARWIRRNIIMPKHQVGFVGSGWEFLWRGVTVFVGSIPVITFPWMAVWCMRWLIRNVLIQRTTA